ncbi:uncharacterized protein LOC125235856 isoform X1 [Leguminivora glycinivorella]|uniref:uncharacterized protein LOC125235856 isoform X1 n=1 Tax=Leguminivora glycinivorella TaxID=1035111 RepID=UPI00200CB457|nr:uncharacterized protein LOC125235856 isoform X1 [Leguminivora glycinivorella]
MDVVAKQFVDLFQDFLQLCQLHDWPDNDTSDTEIKNAFLVAHHIEKCLDKFQRRDMISDVLTILNKEHDMSNIVLKNCFADPPKYILKKIITSNTKITQMDLGFKIFLQNFSDDRLEKCLSELMLEAASKETLLRNLSIEMSRDKLMQFKSNILLDELNNCDDPKEPIMIMLDSCTQDTIDLLVLSLLNKDLKYHKAVNNIINTLITIISKQSHIYKKFWNFLSKVDEKQFIQLCLEHSDLCKIIVKALLDCGKLLKENMSSEYFYIDLTYSELAGIVQTLCKDPCLRLEFEDIVRSSSDDWTFWENMLPS